MKLKFAMLADSAVALPDGKLSIQGGDLDSVFATNFPALHPQLALVVTLVAEPSDRGKELSLSIEGRTPHDEPWFPAISAPIPWREPDTLGRPAKYTFVVSIPMLVLLSAGTYTIRLVVDNDELIALPLYAELNSASESKSAIKESEGVS